MSTYQYYQTSPCLTPHLSPLPLPNSLPSSQADAQLVHLKQVGVVGEWMSKRVGE